ncbi:GNAT family N-acetyltransferase [Alkalimonas sp. NCh-2]|uniref:GNAT family N-acetyltransferase n=1 Tax=Alkalimonas sp. NCh-2 TaxID=3144846 RepID=UPI0031F63896
MTDFAKLVIEPLLSHHDRAGFDCGTDLLNHYIQKQASQDVKRRISRVFIATTAEHPSRIIGYYTLSSLSIALSQLPQELAKKLPHHPIPAALLGRLAVHKMAQQHGVGKILLVDAIKRTLAISEQIGIYAMVVDALNQQAQCFYQQFGFSLLSTENRRLFLPLQSIG